MKKITSKLIIMAIVSLIFLNSCDALFNSLTGVNIVIPDRIVVTQGTNIGEVKISWDSSMDTTYYIYRSNSPSGIASKIAGPINANSFVDTSVDSNTHYWYSISAADIHGESETLRSNSYEGWAKIAAPIIDVENYSHEGFYLVGSQVTVTIEVPNSAELYYTIDGSEPTVGGILATSDVVLTIDNTTTIKAILYNNSEYSELSTEVLTFNSNGNLNNSPEDWLLFSDETQEYFPEDSGYLEESGDGFIIHGTAPRAWSFTLSKTRLDLTGKKVKIKWKIDGDTYYSGTSFRLYSDFPSENPVEIISLSNTFTTSHSYNDSVRVDENVWYYTTISFEETMSPSVTCTGNYAEYGGTLFSANYPDNKGLDFSSLYFAIVHIDPYEGQDTSITVEEILFSEVEQVITSPNEIVVSQGSHMGEVEINWESSLDSTYYIYRSDSLYGTPIKIAGPVSSNYFFDTDVDSNTHYWYSISAADNWGENESVRSSSFEGWAKIPAPVFGLSSEEDLYPVNSVVTVTVEVPLGAELLYTVDGSDPTYYGMSRTTDLTLNVYDTATLKAVFYQNGEYSDITTQTLTFSSVNSPEGWLLYSHDAAEYIPSGSGYLEESGDGFIIHGTAYRNWSYTHTETKMDLTGKKVNIKWQTNGQSSYSGVSFRLFSEFPSTDPSQIVGLNTTYTTDHSYNGSVVIDENNWYYTTITFEGETSNVVTCTGDFDEFGGTLFDSNTSDNKGLDLSSIYFSITHIDPYGGTDTSITVENITFSNPVTALNGWLLYSHDAAEYIPADSGLLVTSGDSLTIHGTAYRNWSYTHTENKLDLTGKKVHIKWQTDGQSSYSGVSFRLFSEFPFTDPSQVVGLNTTYTTSHSYNGSVVIDENSWYYTTITFDGETSSVVTCTGDYDELGGTLFHSNTADNKGLDLSSIYFSITHIDPYGGTDTSITAEEVVFSDTVSPVITPEVWLLYSHDDAEYLPSDSGFLVDSGDGFIIHGTAYRNWSYTHTENRMDLTGKKLNIKWQTDGQSSYSGVSFRLFSEFPFTDPSQVVGLNTTYTTSHSYNGSVVIDENSWYYTTITFDGETSSVVTCIGDYDEFGGTQFFSNTTDNKGLDLSYIYFAIVHIDPYGGVDTSISIDSLNFSMNN